MSTTMEEIQQEEWESKHFGEVSLLYQKLGELLVLYEQLFQNIQNCIHVIFHQREVNNIDYLNILLSKLQASASIEVLFKLMDLEPFSDDDKLFLKKNLKKKTEKFNSDRNKVIHGSWDIGWQSVRDGKSQYIPDWINYNEAICFDSKSGDDIRHTLDSLEDELEKCKKFISIYEDLAQILSDQPLDLSQIKNKIS